MRKYDSKQWLYKIWERQESHILKPLFAVFKIFVANQQTILPFVFFEEAGVTYSFLCDFHELAQQWDDDVERKRSTAVHWN